MAIHSMHVFATPLGLVDAGTFIPLLRDLAAVLGLAGVILLSLGLGLRWNGSKKRLTTSAKHQPLLITSGFLLIGTAAGLTVRQSSPETNAPAAAQPGGTSPLDAPGSAALVRLPPSPAASPASGSGFGFEEGIMGWMAENRGDSRAVVKVDSASTRDGNSVLRLWVNLIGGDRTRSKGEAWAEFEDPRDLRNRHVVATLFARQGARGDHSDPNGFQVFVKDTAHRALYGPYTRIVHERWMDVELMVTDTAPPTGWMEEGFDPTQIIALGIKIAAGGNSAAQYSGALYLDAVQW